MSSWRTCRTYDQAPRCTLDHPRCEFDDDEAALAAYDAAWETVMAETLAAGARISHHHGIGLERARWMPDELGQGLEVMRSLQRSLDPAGIMNPGKLGL
ncbi:MAG: FAD-linked oxidase C-terminal domain-containing protein [Micropruina sp.]